MTATDDEWRRDTRDIMAARRMSMSGLAERAGYSPYYVRRVLAGAVALTGQTRTRLAAALGPDPAAKTAEVLAASMLALHDRWRPGTPIDKTVTNFVLRCTRVLAWFA